MGIDSEGVQDGLIRSSRAVNGDNGISTKYFDSTFGQTLVTLFEPRCILLNTWPMQKRRLAYGCLPNIHGMNIRVDDGEWPSNNAPGARRFRS